MTSTTVPPSQHTSQRIPQFGNPEARARRAAERKGKHRVSRRKTSPPEMRKFLDYRARWRRLDGPAYSRTKRFRSYAAAKRFIDLLLDHDAQREYGAVQWITIERAYGLISAWSVVEEVEP